MVVKLVAAVIKVGEFVAVVVKGSARTGMAGVGETGAGAGSRRSKVRLSKPISSVS